MKPIYKALVAAAKDEYISDSQFREIIIKATDVKKREFRESVTSAVIRFARLAQQETERERYESGKGAPRPEDPAFSAI